MTLGNTAENDLLNWYFTNDTAPTRPTAWYVSLHTADPGDTGANELGSSGYTRQQVSNGFSTSTTGAVSNEAQIQWTNSSGGNWTQVTHFGVWSLSSAGTFYGGGSLTAAKTINDGDTATFAIGDLDITLD